LVHTKSTLRFGAQALAEIDDLNQRLNQLTVPTLVIHGGEDLLVPTVSSEALGRVNGVERKVYDGLRHETLNEPEGPEVVADIAEWLSARV
jgi:alpha-beta hydrolase superfamily lysophospholipase